MLPNTPVTNANRERSWPSLIRTCPQFIFSSAIAVQSPRRKEGPMANEEIMILPEAESYPMSSGDGPHSYAQNSRYQKGVVDAAKEMINEAIANKLDIEDPCLNSSNKFQIADLGCSTGPNTFIAVQNIIEAVEFKYHSKQQNPPTLEFQVFFNDHVDNDFNTLFKSLPPSRQYFATGVPGSFHGRLFPKSTLHFVHSSYALHWLSKIPKEIVDSKSPAWNKGRIHCTGTVKEVAEAYFAQYEKDIETFLNARAQELVSGGLMVILLSGLPNGVLHLQTSVGMCYDLLGSCLVDMAKMGTISEEKVHSFNLPLYFPSPMELEALIERNGYFSIEKMDRITHPMAHITMTVQMVTSQIRAFMEELIKKHFGNEIAEELFARYPKKLAENYSIIIDEKNRKNIDFCILLKRKSN